MRTRSKLAVSVLICFALVCLEVAAQDSKPPAEAEFDTPPRFLSGDQPAYTEEAIRARVEGDVVLDVVITDEGKVLEIVVVKALPFGLDDAAVASVAEWKFEPARLNETPVRCKQEIRIPFRIPNDEE